MDTQLFTPAGARSGVRGADDKVEVQGEGRILVNGTGATKGLAAGIPVQIFLGGKSEYSWSA